VILCTGKIAHELMDERDRRGAPAAIVRIEQLYPWPDGDLFSILDRYADAKQVWWVQEEPGNMGAWNYLRGKLVRVVGLRGAELHHIARHKSGSPATGSNTVHEREQSELLAAALAT
jgi:2-oxoglutarate dehydrogenase E1 component